MPSTEAPTHYERTSGTEPESKDHFFKWLNPDDMVQDTGNVEAPVGWVGLVLVDEDMRSTFLIQNTWANVDNVPDAGWYIVRQDDNGLVWGLSYGEDATFNEERARADFMEAFQTYEKWLDQESYED